MDTVAGMPPGGEIGTIIRMVVMNREEITVQRIAPAAAGAGGAASVWFFDLRISLGGSPSVWGSARQSCVLG